MERLKATHSQLSAVKKQRNRLKDKIARANDAVGIG